ncbi:tetratricopeptide repeat protein, partial [Candidatus Dependentiae bacterium]
MNIIKKKRRPIGRYLALAILLFMAIIIYKNPLDQIYNGVQQGQAEELLSLYQYRQEQIARANKLQQEGKTREAIRLYREILHPDKNIANVHIELGKAYMRLKRYDDVLRHMHNALEINPSLAQPHLYIGKAWSRKGKQKKAVAHYQQVLKAHPDNFTAHLQIGLALMKQENYKEALKHNQIALKLNPSNVHASLNTGHVYNK